MDIKWTSKVKHKEDQIIRVKMVYDAQCMKTALVQFADNEGPDQPVQMHRLVWAFVALLQNQKILYNMSTNREVQGSAC